MSFHLPHLFSFFPETCSSGGERKLTQRNQCWIRTFSANASCPKKLLVRTSATYPIQIFLSFADYINGLVLF